MKVFFDTGAWIALQIKNDTNHIAAVKYFKLLQSKRAMLFTNDYVLSETYTRLIYDFGLPAALKFKQKTEEGFTKNLNLIEIDKKEREEAWRILQKFSDHKLSFADATVAANYWSFNLNAVFTFDHHFRNIGIPTN